MIIKRTRRQIMKEHFVSIQKNNMIYFSSGSYERTASDKLIIFIDPFTKRIYFNDGGPSGYKVQHLSENTARIQSCLVSMYNLHNGHYPIHTNKYGVKYIELK